MFMSKKNNRTAGFTLVELMITITIIGILATTVTFSLRRFVIEKRAEEKVLGMFGDLRSLRAWAIRDHCRYLVTLENPPIAGSPTYQIYRDTIGDYLIATAELAKVSAFQQENASAVRIGLPNPPPSLCPNGLAIGDMIGGTWQDTTITTILNNTIIFENDEIGTISEGVVYLQNPSVPIVGYAIVRPPLLNTLKLYKWDGGRWFEM